MEAVATCVLARRRREAGRLRRRVTAHDARGLARRAPQGASPSAFHRLHAPLHPARARRARRAPAARRAGRGLAAGALGGRREGLVPVPAALRRRAVGAAHRGRRTPAGARGRRGRQARRRPAGWRSRSTRAGTPRKFGGITAFTDLVLDAVREASPRRRHRDGGGDRREPHPAPAGRADPGPARRRSTPAAASSASGCPTTSAAAAPATSRPPSGSPSAPGCCWSRTAASCSAPSSVRVCVEELHAGRLGPRHPGRRGPRPARPDRLARDRAGGLPGLQRRAGRLLRPHLGAAARADGRRRHDRARGRRPAAVRLPAGRPVRHDAGRPRAHRRPAGRPGPLLDPRLAAPRTTDKAAWLERDRRLVGDNEPHDELSGRDAAAVRRAADQGSPRGTPDGPTTGRPDQQTAARTQRPSSTQPVGYWERPGSRAGARPESRPSRTAPAVRPSRPDPTSRVPQPALQPEPYGQPPRASRIRSSRSRTPGPYGQPYGQPPRLPTRRRPWGPPPGTPPGYPPYGAFAPPRPDHPQATLALVLGHRRPGRRVHVLRAPAAGLAVRLGAGSQRAQGDPRPPRVGSAARARRAPGMVIGIIGTVLLILAADRHR